MGVRGHRTFSFNFRFKIKATCVSFLLVKKKFPERVEFVIFKNCGVFWEEMFCMKSMRTINKQSFK